MSMELVELRNGEWEAEGMVKLVMMSLEGLMKNNPTALYELFMKCRDPRHQLIGNPCDVLRASALVLRDDEVHDSVRNIVLSAASGSWLGMTIDSPFKSAK